MTHPKNPLQQQALFAVPHNQEELTAWIERHSPEERIHLYTAAGMAWNLASKFVDRFLEEQEAGTSDEQEADIVIVNPPEGVLRPVFFFDVTIEIGDVLSASKLGFMSYGNNCMQLGQLGMGKLEQYSDRPDHFLYTFADGNWFEFIEAA